MPLAWFAALKQESGAPFLADGLSRYGYLPNPANAGTTGLPVGFTSAVSKIEWTKGTVFVGMTCSACHTRQIKFDDKDYRIDGGPAIVDFQKFLKDLEEAVDRVLTNQTAFEAFALAVLGNPPKSDKEDLRKDLQNWYNGFNTLLSRALPEPPWGPGRLDAVSMIFNRLTGLDLDLPDNIKKADAPTRYPFLWNASIQNLTQWPGFSGNGTDLLALSRNLGEVYGVFGTFQPQKLGFIHDYLTINSANFDGLTKLESLIRKIGPPKWPWLTNPFLADAGKKIFDRPTATDHKGGCVECHGAKPTLIGDSDTPGWQTPLIGVWTDTREHEILKRTSDTGVLKGAWIPGLGDPLKDEDLSFNVLKVSVAGAIIEHFALKGLLPAEASQSALDPQQKQLNLPPALKELTGAFRFKNAQALTAREGSSPVVSPPYESRVLQGIWAAAPYLHNGSVASLAELLKPAKDRLATFQIGPDYDPFSVGLAVKQTKFPDSHVVTTDCSDSASGSSRCGHEYGTELSDGEKAALLEYLKTL